MLDAFKYTANSQNVDPNFSNKFKYRKMTVRELEAYMKKHEVDHFYRREKILQKDETSALANLAGLDIYVCNLGGENKVQAIKKGTKRQSVSGQCIARFVIAFSTGYKHLPLDELNVKEFGDLVVEVNWIPKHKHPLNNLEQVPKTPLSKEAKDLLKLAVLDYGFTWPRIQAKQMEELQKQDANVVKSWELFKINAQHFRAQHTKQQNEERVRNFSITTGLEAWGEVINLSKGFAKYCKEFKHLDIDGTMKYLKTPQNQYVWSFCFMSKWQKESLSKNPEVFRFETTPRACPGLSTDGVVYLHTISIHNQNTGKGVPAAFLLTNTGEVSVIYDFLMEVRAVTNFSPAQAIIQNKLVSLAIEKVWGPDFRIKFCYPYIRNQFNKRLNKKIQECQDREKLIRSIISSFDGILYSKTPTEAAKRRKKFINEYKAHPQIMECIEVEWFSDEQFNREGIEQDIARARNLTLYFRKFHSNLERMICLGEEEQQGPNVVVHKLFTFIVPLYAGQERKAIYGVRQKVYDEAEKKAKLKVDSLSDDEIRAKVFMHSEGTVTVTLFCHKNRTQEVVLEVAGLETNKCT